MFSGRLTIFILELGLFFGQKTKMFFWEKKSLMVIRSINRIDIRLSPNYFCQVLLVISSDTTFPFMLSVMQIKTAYRTKVTFRPRSYDQGPVCDKRPITIQLPEIQKLSLLSPERLSSLYFRSVNPLVQSSWFLSQIRQKVYPIVQLGEYLMPSVLEHTFYKSDQLDDTMNEMLQNKRKL